jgi:nucleoside-triphosphatase THEP1
MRSINILTGPVHSGKTTRLIAWVKYHQHSGGILAPVIHHQRYLYSILSNDYRKLEAGEELLSDQEIVQIGNYSFLESSFEWARSELQAAMKKKLPYLIIDEIGPLELSGKGLEPMVTNLLKDYNRSAKNRVILVVREHLLEKIISHYNLEDQVIIDKNFLSTL